MEYFVVDSDWVGLLVTRDIVHLQERLNGSLSLSWNLVLARATANDIWKVVARKIDHDKNKEITCFCE